MTIAIGPQPDGSYLLTAPDGEIRVVAAGLGGAAVVATIRSFEAALPVSLQGVQRMTDVVRFGADYLAAVKAIIDDLETLRTLEDRVGQDSSLFANYLTSPGARTDIVLADLNNASAAVTQLLFTFDSGSPTQKSLLFKLL